MTEMVLQTYFNTWHEMNGTNTSKIVVKGDLTCSCKIHHALQM